MGRCKDCGWYFNTTENPEHCVHCCDSLERADLWRLRKDIDLLKRGVIAMLENVVWSHKTCQDYHVDIELIDELQSSLIGEEE